jgi:hypothetical protein
MMNVRDLFFNGLWVEGGGWRVECMVQEASLGG